MELDNSFIQKACSAILVKSCNGRCVTNVQIDSRLVQQGSLFFAIKGENLDGNDFLLSSYEKGACGVVVRRQSLEDVLFKLKDTPINVFAVEDPSQSLLDLAHEYYTGLNITTAGITGSCGKTTTKEILYSILSQAGPSCKNPGNYNSTTGLPLSMLMAQKDARYAVFELGIDHVGEMDRMGGCLSPDFGLLTSIGPAHLGNFKSLDVVANEKCNLFKYCKKAFACDEILFKEKVAKNNVEWYGLSGITNITNLGLKGWSFDYQKRHVNLSLIGQHSLMDCCGAIKLAKAMGITDSDIRAGLESCKAVKGRSRVIFKDDSCVIDDTYNANLTSFAPILDFVDKLDYQGNKVALLGSMSELGSSTQACHMKLAQKLSETSFSSYVLYGQAMEDPYRILKASKKKVYWSDNIENVKDYALSNKKNGELTLVKGSRAMRMERLVETLEAV